VTEIAVALGRRGATVLMMDTFRTGESEPEASTAEFAARGGEAGLSWRMVSFDRLISTTIRPDGQTFRIPELALQVDLVLNIACLFAEPRARLAGAMYNMMGLLCGRNRRDCSILTLDPESLNDAMVDVVSRIVPDLNIVLVPEVLRRFDHPGSNPKRYRPSIWLPSLVWGSAGPKLSGWSGTDRSRARLFCQYGRV